MVLKDVILIFAILGLAGIFIISIFFLFGYHIIYKRVFKKQQTLTFGKLVLFIILFSYIFVVVGATLLLRNSSNGLRGHLSLHLFSSYRSAWYHYSAAEWRNIVLNIIMFIPFGILLPILYPKLRRSWSVIGICFSGTLFIEVCQFVTKRGIFEIDDIIHNVLGALIGYGFFCCVFTLRYCRPIQIRKLILTLIPLFSTMAVFLAIFVVYQLKEFGIMTQTYAYKIDMKNIELSYDMDFCDEYGQAMVYATSGLASNEQIKTFANDFFSQLETTYAENNTRFIKNHVAYFSAKAPNGQRLSLGVDYLAMTYSYEDYSKSDYNMVYADEQSVKDKLTAYNIFIPESANFTEQEDGLCRFDTISETDGSMSLYGWLECEYYDDDTIKKIYNHLVKCDAVRMVDIISEQEAYERIEKGMFCCDFDSQINSLHILSVELLYEMDTKGFLQPVYNFMVEINGVEQANIFIPALS